MLNLSKTDITELFKQCTELVQFFCIDRVHIQIRNSDYVSWKEGLLIRLQWLNINCYRNAVMFLSCSIH